MTKLLSGRRVLVVEDEMIVLMLIEDLLADLGCDSVTAAATVDQALALIDEQSFDVAMLDANLDGVSSDPVADVLATRRVPFFFSTGFREIGAQDRYSGAHVLKKPFGAEELGESFRRVLSPIA